MTVVQTTPMAMTLLDQSIDYLIGRDGGEAGMAAALVRMNVTGSAGYCTQVRLTLDDELPLVSLSRSVQSTRSRLISSTPGTGVFIESGMGKRF